MRLARKKSYLDFKKIKWANAQFKLFRPFPQGWHRAAFWLLINNESLQVVVSKWERWILRWSKQAFSWVQKRYILLIKACRALDATTPCANVFTDKLPIHWQKQQVRRVGKSLGRVQDVATAVRTAGKWIDLSDWLGKSHARNFLDLKVRRRLSMGWPP